MCQNSSVHDAQQIEQCVAQGMPQKIVKSVKYTIRKRLEAEQKKQQQQQEQQTEQQQEQQHQMQQQNEQIKSCPAQAALKASRTLPAAATTRTTTATTTPAVSSAVTESSINAKRSLLCPYFRKQKETLAGHNSDIGEAHTTNNNNNSNSNSKNSHSNSSSKSNATAYNDALAISTQWTKQQLARLGRTVENLKNSKIYTLLTRTTQPAHVIAICILSFILLTVWPEIIENTSGAEETGAAADAAAAASSLPTQTEPSSWHHLAVIAYLGAFATHFGAQIWMTFVSGLSLYFALPRHTFGQCQQILFPKYFALNAVLSISMLILFVKFFLGQLSVNSCIQLASLTVTALIEVIVRLYLAPPMLRLMLEKYKIEGTVGSGQEVGGLVQGDLVQCPHYQRIHKTFRRIHMTVAIGNIVVLVCTCMHLYYLASKIRLS